jgi:hypothetical protein
MRKRGTPQSESQVTDIRTKETSLSEVNTQDVSFLEHE